MSSNNKNKQTNKQNLMERVKKFFYIQINRKNSSLWHHYKLISGCDDHHQMLHKKILFGCSYIAYGENRIWKKFLIF